MTSVNTLTTSSAIVTFIQVVTRCPVTELEPAIESHNNVIWPGRVIERGRQREGDHGSARGAGEQMRFGEPGRARRRSLCARLTVQSDRPSWEPWTGLASDPVSSGAGRKLPASNAIPIAPAHGISIATRRLKRSAALPMSAGPTIEP